MAVKETTQNQRVLCIVGKHTPTLMYELAKFIAQTQCNIENSRISLMGSEFTAMVLLSGTWGAIAKFENHLPIFEKNQEVKAILTRTQPQLSEVAVLPYLAQVIGLDRVGIINHVTEFFSSRQIDVQELYADTYSSHRTNSRMFSLTLSITIPASIQIADLREQFTLLCDDLNLDAFLEADKS